MPRSAQDEQERHIMNPQGSNALGLNSNRRQQRRNIDLSAASLWMLLLIVLSGLFVAKFVLIMPFYFVVAAMIAIMLGFALINHLEYGIIAYFFIAAFAFGESPGVQSPNSHYKAGLMPSQMLIVFLMMIWIGRMAFTQKRPKLASSALNLPLIMFGSVSFISMVASNILRNTRTMLLHQLIITQIAEVGLLWLSLCAFFLVANGLKQEKYIQRIFVPVVLLGLYSAASRLLNVDLPINIIWGSFLTNAAIAFIFSRLLFDKLTGKQKVYFWILFLVCLVSIFKDLSWISGWLATGVTLLIISAYRSKALAGALITIGFIVLFIYPGLYRDIQKESLAGGDYDRLIIWKDAFGMFMDINPVLGIGPGNYAPYVYYHSTLWWGNNEKTYTTAHNNFVQITAETGLVGLAAFLWVIVAGIVAAHRSARSAPVDLVWLGIASVGIFAGLAIACICGDYLFPSRGNNGIATFGTTVYTWLIIGAAVAAGNLSPQAITEKSSI